MEYAGALGTIIFNESCRLRDLTEAQVGRNQFAVDVAVDCLDGEADHAAEHISALEDKEADMERSLNVLLELGVRTCYFSAFISANSTLLPWTLPLSLH